MRTRKKKKTQCIPGTEEMINMKGNKLMLQYKCANCAFSSIVLLNKEVC